jgi:hypothetical protein
VHDGRVVAVGRLDLDNATLLHGVMRRAALGNRGCTVDLTQVTRLDHVAVRVLDHYAFTRPCLVVTLGSSVESAVDRWLLGFEVRRVPPSRSAGPPACPGS